MSELYVTVPVYRKLSLLEAVGLFNDHCHLRSLVCRWELETGYRLLPHEFTAVFQQIKNWEDQYQREMTWEIFAGNVEKVIS